MAEHTTPSFAPGRFGKTEGTPGVQVRRHHSHLSAGVIARRGAAATLAAAVEKQLGLALPAGPKAVVDPSGALVLLGTGPAQWWIESASDRWSPETLQSMFEGLASVFDQSDSRIMLEVGGPRIRDALAKLLPIDLHPSVFRTGDVAVTSASHIGVHLWQMADAPRYRLAVARSYFGSFWRGFAAAAAEYGCEVDGAA